MSYPQKQNFFMPPEWYPHECCWMQWPHEIAYKNSYKEIESWSHFDFERGRIAWAKVAKAISYFENVNMIIQGLKLSSLLGLTKCYIKLKCLVLMKHS